MAFFGMTQVIHPLNLATGAVHPLVKGAMKQIKGATLPQRRKALKGQIGGAPQQNAFAGRMAPSGLGAGLNGLKRGLMSKGEMGSTRRMIGRKVPRG